MNKKKMIGLMVGAVISTCFMATTLADTGSSAQTQNNPPLPASTVQNCITFLNALPKNFDTLSHANQSSAVTKAAGSSNAADLLQCVKANVCQHQLSSHPNCGKALALWRWITQTPKASAGTETQSTKTSPSIQQDKMTQPTTTATPSATPTAGVGTENEKGKQPSPSINWF